MGGDPRHRLWADGEVHHLRDWVRVRKQLPAGKHMLCVRCGSMVFSRYYECWHPLETQPISACTQCSLALGNYQSREIETQRYRSSDPVQRSVFRATFHSLEKWRPAQFLLHLPNEPDRFVEGAVIDLDEDVFIRVVQVERHWFWHGRFIDVDHSGERAFRSFDQAAAHALATLLEWHARL